MRDRRITKHQGYIGYTLALFVKQVFRMFHPLTLKEIKNGGSIHFFKSFFKVTLIDGYLTAQCFDGQRFTDVLQEQFPRFCYFFPVGFVGKELTGEGIILITIHAFQAIQQQHLGLGIDVYIFKASRIAMIQ